MPYKDKQKKKEYDNEYRQRLDVREKNKIRSRIFRKNYPEKARANQKKYNANGGYTLKRMWAKNNPDKTKGYSKKWGDSNKEKKRNTLINWRDENPHKGREYYLKDRDKILKCNKIRMNKPHNKISHAIGGQIYESIKEKKAGRRWEILLDYTLKDLIFHLENQFNDKMTWGNYGSYWSIDHITPRSWFNFKSVEDEEFKKCWNLNNLQPMTNKENWIKNNNFVGTIRNPIYPMSLNGQKAQA